jgi:hypothetical protein
MCSLASLWPHTGIVYPNLFDINTTGGNGEPETAYPSRAPEFT